MHPSSPSRKLLIQRVLLPTIIGGSLPLAFLLFIILTKEEYFETWMIYPMTIIPLGGALGGAIFFLLVFHRYRVGTKKVFAIIFSIIIYLVSLWISAIIAFNFTGHWD
ncbi:hypothetical protein [Mongoliibacter ruber]|uniref:Potassium transporter KefB n=1 Tax=Mongoliibacter ruber TaxID=1750599 RepID=A0A2T0WQG2_9BACT|nr:hypothetical protein [Mongoliibacter ruber]PRY88915.1 hypothetical protein CLW00_10335 [Mongoliibacter ruber]